MDNFVYEYPTKVLFGKGAAKEHLGKALSAYGPNVMLAYGGGSIHQNGVYDEMMEILHAAGKTVTEFHGIMPNPTCAKVQVGAAPAREKHIDFILAAAGVDALAAFIRECGLPTRLGELHMRADASKLLTPEVLKEVANSSNLIGTGCACVSHEEIFRILKDCQ